MVPIDDVEVVIIGAGFGGLCAAIRLQQAGRSFVLLERAAEIGGTWRDNTYPGAACDVQSHLYSLSFAPNPRWSHRYAGWREILDYLHGLVATYQLAPHLRLGVTVTGASWADPGWTVTTAAGAPIRCRAVIVATGPLHLPSIPDLPGLDSFAGATLHSARWRHDVDLRDRDVVTVGTGASAVQLIPELAQRARSVTVLQRTPAWVIPRDDAAYSELAKAVFSVSPAARKLHRAQLYLRNEVRVLGLRRPALARALQGRVAAHIAEQVDDPATAAALTPSYTLGCKRALISNRYYPTFNLPHVRLVTSPIARVGADAVHTADGARHPADVLVLATGFLVDPRQSLSRMEVTGVDGARLSEVWAEAPMAWRGTLVSGFPNLFTLLGPNTGLGHNSVLLMIEAQVSWTLDALAHADRAGRRAVDVRPEAMAAYNEALQKGLEGTVWSSGCASWYQDAGGRNFSIWPWSTWRYLRTMSRLEPEALTLR